MSYLLLLAVCAASFLLGSIPFGVVVGKVFFRTDIRQVGSGNIGTTNAFRALGKGGGVLVFLLDFGKGILSGLLATAVLWFLVPGGGLEPQAFPHYHDFMALSFFACTAGHVFSPWLGFKGGKGIAVAVGCQFVAFPSPLWALSEIALFAVLVIATRYVSVGSIAAGVFCVILSPAAFWGHPFAIACGCATGLLVVWAHRANIERLLKGTENRIGRSSRAKQERQDG